MILNMLRRRDKHEMRQASRLSSVHDWHSFVSVTAGPQTISDAPRAALARIRFSLVMPRESRASSSPHFGANNDLYYRRPSRRARTDRYRSRQALGPPVRSGAHPIDID